jgi:hypothetical protein
VEVLELGKDIKDDDDDQLFYTKLYLDEKIRERLFITLDSLSMIFQNLNGMGEDVTIQWSEEDGTSAIHNTLYNTHPIAIHGNGPRKHRLNHFSNYVANRYNLKTGCTVCAKPLIPLEPLASLSIALFLTKPVPFVEEFVDFFKHLDYPKEKIDLFIYNNQPYSSSLMKTFAVDALKT